MYLTKIFKTIKPTTPSQRNVIKLNKKHLNKTPLLKNNIIGKKKVTGKNHSGKITVFHKGGGVKKKYRIINFNRTAAATGIICSIEHDPNRNAHIASVFDIHNKNFYYIILPKNQKIGDIINSGKEIKPELGNSLPLTYIPEGSAIHNVSLKTHSKSQISRSAGTFSILKKKTQNLAIIKLSSGNIKRISLNCFATIGIVSNELFYFTKGGKAGHSRWLNKRPTVRGVAMNPIDHPHGGGEGKKSGKKFTPWGKPTKKKVKKKIYEQS
jgi:large subunit ribosomal protein L2